MRDEAPPRYIIDASVVAKWYSKFGEEEFQKADELMDSHVKGKCILISSSLILYELSNALRFNSDFEKEDVLRAIEDFLGLGINLVDFREIVAETIELAFSKDITVYDAAYVALSQVYHVPLIIADYKLFQKVKDLPLVIPLKGMPNRS